MQTITCKDLLKKLSSGYKPIILDIRDRKDFITSHIPNSYNIPYETLSKKFINYLNHNNIYYIICDKGKLSKLCANLLYQNQYKVINIADGFANWKGPIESI